jgi:hypothetical protein
MAKHRFKIRKEPIDSLFRHKASLTERRFSDVCLTKSSKTALAPRAFSHSNKPCVFHSLSMFIRHIFNF